MPDIVPQPPTLAEVIQHGEESLRGRLFECCRAPDWAADAAMVKRARIASRRLRALLELSGGKEVAARVRELDRATSRLGGLRDLDVVAVLLKRTVRKLNVEALVADEARLALAERIASQRLRERARVERRLTPERLDALDGVLAAHTGRPGGQAERPRPEVVVRRLLRRYRRARRRAEELRPSDFVAAHRLRRALRRFRYNLETLAPWRPAAKPLIKGARRLLDELGATADREAALTWLAGNCDLPLATDLQAALEASVARDLEALPSATATVLSDEFQERLVRALTESMDEQPAPMDAAPR